MSRARGFHQTSSAYSLPNDATEHERLDYQTQGINHMMHDDVFHAPIQRPTSILEVGAGTGFVTRMLANMFPGAEVVGVDLSKVPGRDDKKGPLFVQSDIMRCTRQDLLAAPFSFIFGRMLVYGIRDWKAYVQRMYDLLADGGWLECQEIDASTHYDDDGNEVMPYWLHEQRIAFTANGVDMGIAPKLEQILQDAGFINVTVKQYRWMHGPWAGHEETDMLSQLNNGPANFTAFERVLGHTKSADELAQIRSDMIRDMGWSKDNVKHHLFYVVVGQKAEARRLGP